MPRPKIYDDEHFNFRVLTNAKGNSYIQAYRNEWDPEKKRSYPAKRLYVGTYEPSTGRVFLGKKYLSNHPDYEGKELYFEDRHLVEKTEDEALEFRQEYEQTQEDCIIADDISCGGVWVCDQTARNHHILEDLCKVFGIDDGTNLAYLGYYQYQDGGSLNLFEDWIDGVWLPNAKKLSEQGISKLLARVNRAKMAEYFKVRSLRMRSRSKQHNQADETLSDRPRYLVLDSVGLSTYATAIDTVCGEVKCIPELKQNNFLLGIDYETGDVSYAYENEDCLNDETRYERLSAHLESADIDLQDVVLVTDRQFESIDNVQKLVDADIRFVAGVPVSEKCLQDKFKKFFESQSNSAFINGILRVAYREYDEVWTKNECNEKTPLKLFLYRYPELAQQQVMDLHKVIEDVLERKNSGEKVDAEDWRCIQHYVREDKNLGWVKNHHTIDKFARIAGCVAIRTNCFTDPFETLQIFKEREAVEVAYRQFKLLDGAAHLPTTDSTYLGKVMVHVIAQSLRMIHSTKVRQYQTSRGDTLEKAIAILKKLRAVRASGKDVWLTGKVNEKAEKIFAVLGVKKPPKILKL